MSDFGGWLFQCNPRKFQIFRAVEDGIVPRNWAARQHRHEMGEGDRAALWISQGETGYPSGVYGIGTIESTVWKGEVDRRYWTAHEPEPRHFVDIAFDRWVFHHPVASDELRCDADFADAAILAMPRATDFVLTAAEWVAIERRIVRRNPTSAPTLVSHR